MPSPGNKAAKCSPSALADILVTVLNQVLAASFNNKLLVNSVKTLRVTRKRISPMTISAADKNDMLFYYDQHTSTSNSSLLNILAVMDQNTSN